MNNDYKVTYKNNNGEIETYNTIASDISTAIAYTERLWDCTEVITVSKEEEVDFSATPEEAYEIAQNIALEG